MPLVFAISCVPAAIPNTSKDPALDKKLLLEDYIYEQNIHTMQLYESRNIPDNSLLPAVIPLLQKIPLLLKFDDFAEQADNYYAKFIHCNANWTKSLLHDLDFLGQYNEFNINDYEYSFDTRTEYVHYTFELPRVKLPGNYVLLVYRNDPSDPILTRRFMVYDNKVKLQYGNQLIGLLSTAKLNQQIEFDINYYDFVIDNPLQSITVHIRQNQRWDNAILDLKPSFIKPNQNLIEYHHFKAENNFRGSNEFRFFDLRSLRFFGQNVDAVNILQNSVDAQIMDDFPRTHHAYSQVRDLNGGYLIQNQDTRSPEVSSEYVNVNFKLKTNPVGGSVYVVGWLNNWRKNIPMHYDSGKMAYTSNLRLKQGWYDYMYEVKGDTLESNFFEGNHFQTENEYEIFVYYKPITFSSDLLIGYSSFVVNNRD